MYSTGNTRIRSLATALAVFICCLSLVACNQDADDIAALQTKLESVDARLTELDAKVDAVRENVEQGDAEELAEIQAALDELKESQSDLLDEAALFDDTGFRRRGFDMDTLKEIELPGDADRATVEQYIREIMRVSSKQNSFSTTDPQVEMLKRVGEDNIDLLLEAAVENPMGDMYAVQAVVQLATEDSKALVLDALPALPALIDAVVQEGWEDDAKATLVEGLTTNRYLPELWLQAVAGFQDPETYDALTNFLIRGQNRLATFDAIRDLPGIELQEAVEKAWSRASREDAWERKQMAIVAVEFGVQEALEVLIEQPGAPSDYYYPRARLAVQRHSGAGGSHENMRQWYEANKDKLYFDDAERKFKVRD